MRNPIVKLFPFWCHKILPLVYDDSLSYYEVLCKLMHKINDLIEQFNDLLELPLMTYRGSWNNSTAYDPYSVVYDSNGNVYISTTTVPSGTSLSNTNYWTKLVDKQTLVNEINSLKNRVSTLEGSVVDLNTDLGEVEESVLAIDGRVNIVEENWNEASLEFAQLSSQIAGLQELMSYIDAQLDLIGDKAEWAYTMNAYVPFPEDDTGYAWLVAGRHVGLFQPKANAPTEVGGGALPSGVYWLYDRWCKGTGGSTSWGSTVIANCTTKHNTSSPASIDFGTTDNKPKLVYAEPHDGFYYLYAYNLDGTVYSGDLYLDVITLTPKGLLTQAQLDLIADFMYPVDEG